MTILDSTQQKPIAQDLEDIFKSDIFDLRDIMESVIIYANQYLNYYNNMIFDKDHEDYNNNEIIEKIRYNFLKLNIKEIADYKSQYLKDNYSYSDSEYNGVFYTYRPNSPFSI